MARLAFKRDSTDESSENEVGYMVTQYGQSRQQTLDFSIIQTITIQCLAMNMLNDCKLYNIIPIVYYQTFLKYIISPN